jgi:hypothetical protein
VHIFKKLSLCNTFTQYFEFAAVQRLSNEDFSIICGYALKVRDHLLDATFERFPLAFPSVSLPSVRQARRRLENLAGFKTVLYDCCPNSCMCYLGPHDILDHCLYCKEPRRDEAGKP